MLDHNVLAFTAIAALVTITPGADTFLVIRNVLRGGRRAGIATTLGICSGLFVHATLSAVGLSLILLHSATLYTAMKWAGALYLAWLGVRSLRDAFRGGETVVPPPAGFHVRAPSVEGFANNLLNPKVAVFYLAFLPQFVGPHDPVLAKSLLLASIHFVEGIVWLCVVACVVDRGRAFMASPRARRTLEGVAGAVLLSFGLRLATDNSR